MISVVIRLDVKKLYICKSKYHNVINSEKKYWFFRIFCTKWLVLAWETNHFCHNLELSWTNLKSEFYIHGFVRHNSILIRSNKMQQYADIYLLQNYCTRFGCPSHPSSGVHKTVIAASGTGHSNNIATTFLQRGLSATLEEGCCSDTTTCTRGWSYSFMYSWWWVRWTPETCRVVLQ